MSLTNTFVGLNPAHDLCYNLNHKKTPEKTAASVIHRRMLCEFFRDIR